MNADKRRLNKRISLSAFICVHLRFLNHTDLPVVLAAVDLVADLLGLLLRPHGDGDLTPAVFAVPPRLIPAGCAHDGDLPGFLGDVLSPHAPPLLSIAMFRR